MWKIFVAFAIFAAIALTVVFKMGDKIDMQGEAGGGAEQHQPAEASTPATAPADTSAPAAATTATEEKK